MEIVAILTGLDLILLLVAFLFIAKASTATSRQKIYQALLSVGVPLIGPAVTIAVHWADRMKPIKPSDRYMGQSIDETRHIWSDWHRDP